MKSIRLAIRTLAALSLLSAAACGMSPYAELGGGSPWMGQAQGLAPRLGSGVTSLFVEPDDGTAPVLDAINSAQQYIKLEVYMLTSPDVESALEQAAGRGVAVSVILDRKPYTRGGPNPNDAAFSALSQAGVKVQWSLPQFTYTHEKSMVVDGTEAVIMSLNLTNSGLASNREYGVIDHDPQDIAAVGNIFDSDWQGQGNYMPTAPNLVVSPVNSRNKLEDLMNSARSTLFVQDEELNDPQIIQLLGQKVQQGVDVEVELANLGRSTPREVSALQAAGVQQVKVLRSPFLHAKLIIADGSRAYTGSVNLSSTSMDQNREVGILLDDPSEIGRLDQIWSQDWSAGQ